MQAAGASCGKTHATWSELFWFHHGLVTEKCHVIFSQSQSATIRYQNTVKPFTVNLFSRVRLVTSISGAYFPFVNGLYHFLRTMPPLFTNDDGKTTTLHVYRAFLVHFFAVTARRRDNA